MLRLAQKNQATNQTTYQQAVQSQQAVRELTEKYRIEKLGIEQRHALEKSQLNIETSSYSFEDKVIAEFKLSDRHDIEIIEYDHQYHQGSTAILQPTIDNIRHRMNSSKITATGQASTAFHDTVYLHRQQSEELYQKQKTERDDLYRIESTMTPKEFYEQRKNQKERHKEESTQLHNAHAAETHQKMANIKLQMNTRIQVGGRGVLASKQPTQARSASPGPSSTSPSSSPSSSGSWCCGLCGTSDDNYNSNKTKINNETTIAYGSSPVSEQNNNNNTQSIAISSSANEPPPTWQVMNNNTDSLQLSSSNSSSSSSSSNGTPSAPDHGGHVITYG